MELVFTFKYLPSAVSAKHKPILKSLENFQRPQTIETKNNPSTRKFPFYIDLS